MSETTVRKVLARPTFDGCARPSFEVLVETAGASAVAAPSYSDPRSSGKYEINHFPDGGVAGSIDLINTRIDGLLRGCDAADQQGIDDALTALDGTHRFERIGGNTAEAVSMAVAKAAAASLGVPLYRHASGGCRTLTVPHLMLNIIGGGATMGDEGWRGRTPDMQDHLIVPVGCETELQAMGAIARVFHETGRLLREADRTFAGGRDEEYCWLPGVDDVACLEVLEAACDTVSAGRKWRFRLGLDVGASDLWSETDGAYVYAREGVKRSRAEQARHVADLIERFDLFYVEDAFFEDHPDLYREQVQAFGDRTLIVGDDLLATNEARLVRLADDGAVNAAVVKLNMAGTVSRTGRFTNICRERGMATIGAARTYDSPDDTLADLVVGWGHTGYKCGAPAGGEHVAKFNRFIRIEEELRENGGTLAEYPGVRP